MSEFNNETQLKIPEELVIERYVPGSGISREEAKRICEKHGVVWDVK